MLCNYLCFVCFFVSFMWNRERRPVWGGMLPITNNTGSILLLQYSKYLILQVTPISYSYFSVPAHHIQGKRILNFAFARAAFLLGLACNKEVMLLINLNYRTHSVSMPNYKRKFTINITNEPEVNKHSLQLFSHYLNRARGVNHSKTCTGHILPFLLLL